MYCKFTCFVYLSQVGFKWSDRLKTVKVKKLKGQPVGPSVVLPATPGEVFRLFFTSAILNTIVQKTNLYAQQSLGDKFWNEVTESEILAFTGFMILMGIVHIPSIYDYWSKNENLHYHPISKRISRDRFKEIT